MNPIQIIFIYLGLVSLASIILTISDKHCAKTHKWRVRESTLLIFSALGGSLAMYLTMQIIRHKTQKLKFMLSIPVMIVIQAVVLWLVINNVR